MWITLSKRSDNLCPVFWFDKLASILESDTPSQFLFHKISHNCFVESSSVSKLAMAKRIKFWVSKISLDPKNYSPHSLRSGGATAAHLAGIPDTLIQAQGRWSSDAYKIYVRFSVEELLEVTRSIT